MRVLLAGHKDTKQIVTASSWLIKKYLPSDLDVYFLNFGILEYRLFTGTYVPLADEQVGGINAWSKYLREYISTLSDEFIIFSLDDYLINAPMDIALYKKVLKEMHGVDCARLNGDYIFTKKTVKDGISYIGQDSWTCTSQYCIWRKSALLNILSQVKSPWEFEEGGSTIFNKHYKLIATEKPIISYADTGCLSRKWSGVKTDGLSEEDIAFLKKYGYI